MSGNIRNLINNVRVQKNLIWEIISEIMATDKYWEDDEWYIQYGMILKKCEWYIQYGMILRNNIREHGNW